MCMVEKEKCVFRKCEKWVGRCIKEKFDLVCQNLSYKFDVMKTEEEL